jgi:hypothetical protein
LQWKNEEPHMHSQEMGYSASNLSSSVQTRRHQRILHESLSPVLRSHKILSPKTEGHNNALKNIKVLPFCMPLQQISSTPMKATYLLNIAGLFLKWISEIVTQIRYQNSFDSTKILKMKRNSEFIVFFFS